MLMPWSRLWWPRIGAVVPSRARREAVEPVAVESAREVGREEGDPLFEGGGQVLLSPSFWEKAGWGIAVLAALARIGDGRGGRGRAEVYASRAPVIGASERGFPRTSHVPSDLPSRVRAIIPPSPDLREAGPTPASPPDHSPCPPGTPRPHTTLTRGSCRGGHFPSTSGDHESKDVDHGPPHPHIADRAGLAPRGPPPRATPGPRPEPDRPVTAVSPDGSTLAVAERGRAVRLYRRSDGHRLRAFSGKSSRTLALAFSPDGHSLASAGEDGRVRLWDLAREVERRELPGHDGPAVSVAFSPTGTLLATEGADGLVRVWESDTGRLLRTLPGPGTSLAFDPS